MQSENDEEELEMLLKLDELLELLMDLELRLLL